MINEIKYFVVLGLGITGTSVVKKLSTDKNNILFIWDDDISRIQNTLCKMRCDTGHNNAENVKVLDIKNFFWDCPHYLVPSPGINLKTHSIAKQFIQNNSQVLTDIDILWMRNSDKKFIGITGTNGKSTTSSLVAHIIRSCTRKKVEFGGNIGVSAILLDDDADYYVIEISSYQLLNINKLILDYAVILNITLDHLDIHKTFEQYINAKKTILNLLNNIASIGLINLDDTICSDIYKNHCGTQKLMGFQLNNNISNAVTDTENGIVINSKLFNKQYEIPRSMIGEHNARNIACAIKITNMEQIPIECAIRSIKCFNSLPYRMENIAKFCNIEFINDSKATNVASSAVALSSFKNIYWIVGGRRKEDNINELLQYAANINTAYIIGESQDFFAYYLESVDISYKLCNELEYAIYTAYHDANKDYRDAVILLSPACSSFDQWRNFEERGNSFNRVVDQIINQ